jgi:hypothetical protein
MVFAMATLKKMSSEKYHELMKIANNYLKTINKKKTKSKK